MATTKKLLLGTVTKGLAERMLREAGRSLASELRDALPAEYGFVLVLKDPLAVAFFTDAEREAAIGMLRDVLSTLERS